MSDLPKEFAMNTAAMSAFITRFRQKVDKANINLISLTCRLADGEPQSCSDLAGHLEVSTASLTGIKDRAVENGLASENRTRKQNHITISEKGLSVLVACHRAAVAAANQMKEELQPA